MPSQNSNSYQATLEKIGMDLSQFKTKISDLDGCLEVMSLMRKNGASMFKNPLWLRAGRAYHNIFLCNYFENEKEALEIQKQYCLITDGPDLGGHFGKNRFYNGVSAARCDHEYRTSGKHYHRTKRI